MINDEELRMISRLAEHQVKIEEEIKNLQNLLDENMQLLKKVSTIDLPAAMQEIGMESFVLNSGRKITLKTDVYCSIPKDDGGKAFRWLRENEFGSIIKNVISTEFGKGEDEKALEAAKVLAEAGFKPNQKESIHAMTLKAFVNEQMNSGKNIPLDLFGAFIVTKSKVV